MERGTARLWLAIVGALLISAGCGQTEDLVLDQGVGLANGATCGGSTECTSGFCVDSVCCESACNGTCEACNVPNQLGSCVPVPTGTDPALECTGMSAGDGGVPNIDGGINVPDGGVTAANGPCAGTCDGARACKFPGKETTCGSSFCNDTELQLAYSCDKAGGCSLQPTTCVAYICGPEACKTSCIAQSDCLSGYYCNGSSECVPQHATGVMCSLGYECQTGFCDGDVNPGDAKVCCDTDCDPSTIPGATCIANGHEGQCQCMVTCDPGNNCVATYPDADGDGFGDQTYTPTPADVYCEPPNPADPPDTQHPIPSGRTTDHTDCYDHNAMVYPGPRKSQDQTCHKDGFTNCCYDNYYTVQRGDGSFDYNCDGVESHFQNEVNNGIFTECHFCDASASCSNTDTACGTSGEGSQLTACAAEELCTPFEGGTPYENCGPCLLLFLCGSATPSNTGFIGTVGCGASSTFYTCGTCSAAGGAPQVTTTSMQQSCL